MTNLEVMGAQLQELCKHEPDGLSKIQGIFTRCPNAAMYRDSDGRTALHVLCAHRPPLQSVAFLAANPMSCLQQTTKGMLPLHYACRNNASEEVVEFLLGQCPETVRMANSSGWLALHLACARGASLQVIEKLVNAWPDSVRQATNDGRMALHFACANHAPLEVVQLLIMHCREALSVQDQNEWAPLHIACAYSENVDVITYLAVECPEILQSRGNLGRLPIHVACWEGQQLPIVEFLVHACPLSLLKRDINHLLPLHCACLGSASQPVIEFLIEQSPDSVLEIGLTVQEVARHVCRESGRSSPPLLLCQWLHRVQPALIYDIPSDQKVNQTLPDVPMTRNSVSPAEDLSKPKTSIDQAPVAREGSQSHTQTQTLSDDEAQLQNDDPTTARRPRRANKATGQQQQPKKLPPDAVIAGQQLHKACEAPQSLNEIMQILSETPTAIEMTTYGNALPIHTAALNQASSVILKFLVRLLPSSLLQADSEGNLPIHLACYSGASLESIKFLVKECPESVKWKNIQQQTPLDKAKQPFMENPDAQVISFLENTMSSAATSSVGNEPLHQGAVRPPMPTAGTNPIERSSSEPSYTPNTAQRTVLPERGTSLQANEAEMKPKVSPPLEIPLGHTPGSGNAPSSFVQARIPSRPQSITRSFTTPTGWARNVPGHGPHGTVPPAPPQFHGQGNFSHPSPSQFKGNSSLQPPPPLSIDPYFRDCPPARVPPSPNTSPLRGGGRSTSNGAAPGTPSAKNRAPSPTAAQRRLPSPAIIFGGGRATRSRSRSPSPSPMMRGIAGFFRRKGGNNSRNSSPLQDLESVPLADVVLVTSKEQDLNNISNNSNNAAPKQNMGLPDAPFMNEVSLPTLQRNQNATVTTEANVAPPNRPASMSSGGCFSPDELARLRGQDYQPINVNETLMSRGGAGMTVNQPQEVAAMPMNGNASSVPRAVAKKPTNNDTTTPTPTPRVFQRPMVVEAGTLTERAFRPGAVAVNEPVLRPDTALYRAVNAPRAPSPVRTTTLPQQQPGRTTVVPQPYRPGFSHSPPRATNNLPESSRPQIGGDMDEPDIVVLPIPMDDYQVALERSRQVELNLLPTPGMQQDAIMEMIRMQELGLLDGVRSSNTSSPSNGSGPSTNQGVVPGDRRLATIEAANIGSFYRSAIVSGDVAPIDFIPAMPEEEEDASIMHMNHAQNVFGPPLSPPTSFVNYQQQQQQQEHPSLMSPGAAGRMNRWAVMTGSPAGQPVSSFYRDAMRTAEDHAALTADDNNNNTANRSLASNAEGGSGIGNRMLMSSFYRTAILEAANQGGNHDGLLAGIDE